MVSGSNEPSETREPSGPTAFRDRTRQRAQLILIGAIALAVVIIGLTVIVNSLYVTEVDTISEASPQIDEAREFEYESNKGTRSLLMRLNHRHRNLTAADLEPVLRDNVTVYSQLMAESYASSRGEYVNITYNNESSGFGSRVVQAADGNVTDNSEQETWFIGRGIEYRELGWFTMNVNLEETSEDRLFLNVSNSSGEWVNYSLNRTDSTDGVVLRVHSNVSHAGNATALCDPSRDRVLVDFLAGDTFTGDCQFNGTSEVDGPYRVHVENGKNVVAKYELVYNESVESHSRYRECNQGAPPFEPADDPCAAPAVWEANVSTRFVSSELNYTNAFNVSVYSEAP